MRIKERLLTGLALALLSIWEASIGEIPLGLFTINHIDQASLFTTILVLQVLSASILLSCCVLPLKGRARQGRSCRVTPTALAIESES